MDRSKSPRPDRAAPGTPRIDDRHYRPTIWAAGALATSKTSAEWSFLDLGEGARLWLVEAAATGDWARLLGLTFRVGATVRQARVNDDENHQVQWSLLTTYRRSMSKY